MRLDALSPWPINLGLKDYISDREGVTWNARVVYFNTPFFFEGMRVVFVLLSIMFIELRTFDSYFTHKL